MADRRCAWCDTDISHMKSNARYCSRLHKKSAASKRERNPGYYAKYSGTPSRIAYSETNRDRLRAYAREYGRRYRAEHPDAAADWWAANPEKHRLYQAKRRAATVSEARLVTERDIRRLMARHAGHCAYCLTEVATDLDHVVPLAMGGRHSIGNLLPACRSCNASKNSTPLFLWRVRTLLQREGERLLLEAG